MNKQQLAAKIWEQANAMRSKIEANEYKDYILGFIFYKYLSDQEIKFLLSENFTTKDIENLTEDNKLHMDYIRDHKGYAITYDNLFSTWIEKGRDFEIADVRMALSAFTRHLDNKYKKLYDGIFDTLETGLSKLGENAATQTKAASELIYLIDEIPMDGKQDYDVLGFIYEYLIGMFAANAGKKAGEFYTPHEVSMLMAEITADHLKNKEEIRIYDPTSGSGSLLINIGKAVSKHMNDKNKIMYYAQELKQNTYNLTRMNLIMRDINPNNIRTRNADTLEEDWPYFDENDVYELLQVDAVVSNPPYSQKWDPTHKESDPRYSYGLAPKTKADYAFLLHDLYHLKNDGIMTIVLPHGVLFRGGEEGVIRKNLIENNHIDTIIGLPANIFFGTGIPTIIMILKKKARPRNILFVDASKGFVKEGKSNKLRSSDIKKIVDTVIQRKDIPKFARLVDIEEIKENDYNLNIPRYVDSFDEGESWDIYASMFGGIPKLEIDKLEAYWLAYPSLKEDIFTESSTPYVEIKENYLNAFKINSGVVACNKRFYDALASIRPFLKSELINNLDSIVINKTEKLLSDDLFARLEGLELVDKYQAYQIFSDIWDKISIDLEIISTEGFDSVRKVDPNMVIKKKNGKDVEVQEGWIGRILPFELVQEHLLSDELAQMRSKEERRDEIAGELEELLDSLTEEDRNEDFVKEDNTAFAAKALATKIKDLKDDDTEEGKTLLQCLSQAEKLIKENTDLNKVIKKDSDALHMQTKTTIEGLSDDEAKQLLEKKWINPIENQLLAMPEAILTRLMGKIQSLGDKYGTTFESVQTEIRETEKELSAMIAELEGDDYDLKGLEEFRILLGGDDA